MSGLMYRSVSPTYLFSSSGPLMPGKALTGPAFTPAELVTRPGTVRVRAHRRVRPIRPCPDWSRAVFDRTKDGKISQRNFGGHEYPRLAHVGDRTGLEMITLQQKVVALQQEDAVEFGDLEAMIKVSPRRRSPS